jgi:hypothetical protein
MFAALVASCSFPHGPPPPFPAPPPQAEVAFPAPHPAPRTPAAVRAEIIRWFWTHGYKAFQISALLGHARDESGYRPCAVGPDGLRYLYQWGGTRLQRLHRFAGTNGCPPLDTQLAFANLELRGEPKFACFWLAPTAITALSALRRGFGRGSC